MRKTLSELIAAAQDGVNMNAEDPVDCAFIARDYQSVVRLLAVQGSSERPEVYGFAKAMLSHADAHLHLTLQNAGDHAMARTIAACCKAGTWRRWGKPKPPESEVEEVRRILIEATEGDDLQPVVAGAMAEVWWRAFGSVPSIGFVEKALRLIPDHPLLVKYAVDGRRVSGGASADDIERLMNCLPTWHGGLLEASIEVAFEARRQDLLEAALSSVDDENRPLKEAIRCAFLSGQPLPADQEAESECVGRLVDAASDRAVGFDLRCEILLRLAISLAERDQTRAMACLSAAWEMLSEYGKNEPEDPSFLVDPWVAVDLKNHAGERAIAHLPATPIGSVRAIAKSASADAAGRAMDLVAFVAIRADEEEDGDAGRVRSCSVEGIPPIMLPTAVRVELESGCPSIERIAEIILRASELQEAEETKLEILYTIVQDVSFKEDLDGDPVSTAIAAARSAAVKQRIKGTRDSILTDGDDEQSTSGVASSAHDLTLLEAAVLTGLFRSPVDHVETTVGPIEGADRRFEPYSLPGKQMQKALFSLMSKGLISVSGKTPKGAITEEDGQKSYYLLRVVWSFHPNALAILNEIRDTTKDQWPEEWKASFRPLLEEIGANEVLEYLNHQLSSLGMDPVDDPAIIETTKVAFAGGKPVAHVYYLASKTAKDALAYRERYRPRHEALQTRIVNLFKDVVDRSIEAGWDNAYSRIKELPESILFDVLHRTIGRRGKAAFETAIR